MGHHAHKVWQNYSVQEFKEQCALHVEALNHATRNIPADRLRLHLCWGNYEGPHTHDVEFRDIAPEVYQFKGKYLLVETANPRHAHTVEDFRQACRLPAEKVIIPGVIDTK